MACYSAPMRLNIIPLALLLAFIGCKSVAPSNPSTAENPSETATPRIPQPNLASATGFDFYLLNLSWSPEFCYSRPDAAECGRHSTFVLHGLWPQNNDGTYPEHCGNGSRVENPAQFSDIYPEPGLLEHEWQQHGACTALSPHDFFLAARTAYQSVKIPSQLANLSSQTSMPPDQIASLFSQSNPGLPQNAIAISCGHNYLTAVEVCLDKSLHPIACPRVRSCRANTVRIPPPQ